jgi:flagellar biosynthetic protein FliQ
MTEQAIIDLGSRTVWVAILVASPALITTLVIGLLVSIFQAATQINEQTLSFIPKIIMMTIALILCGPWILHTMLEFTISLYSSIPQLGH